MDGRPFHESSGEDGAGETRKEPPEDAGHSTPVSSFCARPVALSSDYIPPEVYEVPISLERFQRITETPNWSQGARLHRTGECKPCSFFHREESCENEWRCNFCHLCPTDEGRRRKKMKHLLMKARKGKQQQEVLQAQVHTRSSSSAAAPDSAAHGIPLDLLTLPGILARDMPSSCANRSSPSSAGWSNRSTGSRVRVVEDIAAPALPADVVYSPDRKYRSSKHPKANPQ